MRTIARVDGLLKDLSVLGRREIRKPDNEPLTCERVVIMSGSSDIHRTTTETVAKTISNRLEGYHVLLAEDSPDQQRLFATLLQQAGAWVTLECNGEAAVDMVLHGREHFDAVILDFVMPVMDGVEATRQLRHNGYTKPIVAITAHGNQISEQEWLAAGADVFLLKPLGPTDFISQVQGVL